MPRPGSAPSAGRPVVVSPRGGAFRPYYYPYSYPYRYGYGASFGFYGGYPYYSYAYPYSAYGYYGGPYAPYPYGYPGGVIAVSPGDAYGGVRIEGAPHDAQVFADGYYAGVVDDFDGKFQRLSLAPGAHQIEIRVQGQPPIAFDVRVEPGQTINYRADSR